MIVAVIVIIPSAAPGVLIATLAGARGRATWRPGTPVARVIGARAGVAACGWHA